MRKLLIVGTAFLLAIALGVGSSLAQKAHTPRIEADKIRDAVKYLSSDELEGRGTGQKGGDTAADWIAAQFRSYGLKPAGAKGSYFQDVPMVGVKTLPQTTFSLVPKDSAPVALKNLDDYVTSNESQSPMSDFDAPIVFVGYGITAPEYQWDDYKGVDLNGKVALLFVSEPESNDPNFFKGKALTYYGRWTYKYEETARHGAVATLIIHRTDLASYGWDVVRIPGAPSAPTCRTMAPPRCKPRRGFNSMWQRNSRPWADSIWTNSTRKRSRATSSPSNCR